MAITSTTLPAAITGYATTFPVTSATGMSLTVFPTAVGTTILYIENEFMRVRGLISNMVTVERGLNGTQALAHAAGSLVLIGGNLDFPNFVPQVASFTAPALNRYQGVSAPVAAAATIVAPGSLFHVTGTTATNIITPPDKFVEGSITIIPDGAWSWASSAVTNGIALSGSATATSVVTFTYDAATALWYPSQTKDSRTVSVAVAAAATLAASGTLFHVTGTTATNIITPPTNFTDQAITIIADGAWTWTSSAVANGIAQTGAVTSAGESVTFTYDPTTTFWYPSRVG